MPNEKDTGASHRDALNAYESLFGDAEPRADDVVAKEQDAKNGTGEEQQLGSEVTEDQAETGQEGAGESDQAPREPDIPEKQADESQADGKETSPPNELKVVVSIKDGRATIGVQKPSSDPHVEVVVTPDLSEVVGEIPAVLERARTRWEDAPKHPAHARPTPSTRGRGRREQSSAKDRAAEGEAAQPQQETLKLF